MHFKSHRLALAGLIALALFLAFSYFTNSQLTDHLMVSSLILAEIFLIKMFSPVKRINPDRQNSSEKAISE